MTKPKRLSSTGRPTCSALSAFLGVLAFNGMLLGIGFLLLSSEPEALFGLMAVVVMVTAVEFFLVESLGGDRKHFFKSFFIGKSLCLLLGYGFYYLLYLHGTDGVTASSDMSRQYHTDSLMYLDIARSIAFADGIPGPDYIRYYGEGVPNPAVLHVYMLAGILRLIGDIPELLPFIELSVYFASAVVLCHALPRPSDTRRSECSRIMIAVALCPAPIYWSATGGKESLIVLAGSVIFLALIRLADAAPLGRAAILGGLCIAIAPLSLYLRSSFGFYLMCGIGLVILRKRIWPRGIWRLLLSAFAIPVVFAGLAFCLMSEFWGMDIIQSAMFYPVHIDLKTEYGWKEALFPSNAAELVVFAPARTTIYLFWELNVLNIGFPQPNSTNAGIVTTLQGASNLILVALVFLKKRKWAAVGIDVEFALSAWVMGAAVTMSLIGILHYRYRVFEDVLLYAVAAIVLLGVGGVRSSACIVGSGHR